MLTTLYDFVFNTEDMSSKILVKSTSLCLSIVFFYVITVKWILPEIMKKRKPFNLRKVIIIYNFAQTVMNIILAYHFNKFIIDTWHIRCGTKYNENKDFYLKPLLKYTWYLYLVKYLDFLDTVFFTLRKKFAHITFLHVFHHALMVPIYQLFLRNFSCNNEFGYYVFVAAAFNTIVHTVMYFYYGLSALGPHMQKYLWWKKYITLMQIAQFILLLLYIMYGIITGCDMPDEAQISLFIYTFLVLILFINFYIKSFKVTKAA